MILLFYYTAFKKCKMHLNFVSLNLQFYYTVNLSIGGRKILLLLFDKSLFRDIFTNNK